MFGVCARSFSLCKHPFVDHRERRRLLFNLAVFLFWGGGWGFFVDATKGRSNFRQQCAGHALAQISKALSITALTREKQKTGNGSVFSETVDVPSSSESYS